jgi:transcriptional regulator with XRE-family HTH domain
MIKAPSRRDKPAAAVERHLGLAIREQRLKNHLTIADISNLAGISRGMLSRIENGQTSTSLDSLSRIARALGVSLSSLFRGFDSPGGGAQLVKSGAGMEVVRRGTKQGHTYHLLAYGQGPKKHFEPFLISMDDESETFPTFEHPGIEFIYMLDGVIEYRHGQHTYELQPGDALSFRGEIAHGPERLIKLPIRFLSIIYYPGESAEE